MNAAAKVINQSTLFHGQWAELHMSKSMLMIMILLFGVLTSALGVIYTTNAYRNTLGLLQQAEIQTHQLQLQWGQLLLEQASLARPARVQQLATDKLGMRLPDVNNSYLLQAK